ncbi:M23 family metallopeptidase [Thermoflavifilum thermophilum]|uniref:Murein DD-endopeptidase MepM and murein hydrolase activator NlpD, contain LysM domain n=1 Tax=Thermoflavifilum thermophilum TaxID=1393122 RepID=A0A1I7N8M4_9BACT|nr:M23 family metallopeptidase [Thermoflavifilum thermophilum]SFV31005.1 Murein DD-endopeptidase MepM and murein hydrolase activator NlpD, contain LysM domain [Thermoflavifilum thermophilum]
MKKIKYYYDTRSLRYERWVMPLWMKLLRTAGILLAILFTAILIFLIASPFLDTPHDKMLRQDLLTMREQYHVLTGQLHRMEQQLRELQSRDNQIYRAIFAASPIPDSLRAHEQARIAEMDMLDGLSNTQLISNATAMIRDIEHRIHVQNQSYAELDSLVQNKQKLLASIPAIEPIPDEDINRIASGFGYRIDPIYKTRKFHPGIDFAASEGTPIYATGNGVVEWSGMDESGYGVHVIIRHGFGYETLYGHLEKTVVKKGEQVKRGQIIGYVGSTGKSTGPHCHYEVIRNGVKVNPVYFFYNDITPQQYERILKMAAANNQSLD